MCVCTFYMFYRYIHMYTCIYTYIYIYMCVCVYIYIYIYIYMYIWLFQNDGPTRFPVGVPPILEGNLNRCAVSGSWRKAGGRVGGSLKTCSCVGGSRRKVAEGIWRKKLAEGRRKVGGSQRKEICARWEGNMGRRKVGGRWRK